MTLSVFDEVKICSGIQILAVKNAYPRIFYSPSAQRAGIVY